MREGRLGYNCENDRYGLLSMDLWIDTGFHCGECLEVLVDDHTNGNESGERMVSGRNAILRRSGMYPGKNTRLNLTGK